MPPFGVTPLPSPHPLHPPPPHSDSPVPREPPPCPVLILWGGCDAFLDPRLAPYLQRRLAPKARLHLIPNAGHWLPEERPQEVNGLLWDFLLGEEGEGTPN